MRNLKFFFLVAFILLPISSLAHVKWFAKEETSILEYKISNSLVLIWIIISLILIFVGTYLEKKLRVPDKIKYLIEKYSDNALSVASIGFGLAFIIFSAKGFIFAPNLPALGELGGIMLILQILIGTMILLGIHERLAGGMLLGLFSLGVVKWGAIEMLDTLEILGFAFYVIIVGRPKWRIAETISLKERLGRFKPYAVPILRVGTGLNLLILGFSEKILAPSLTQNFLEKYDWNFMQNLGFENFNNYYFAFSAGMVEALFGIFLLFGLITRTTTLALTVFLISTLALLGPIELIGHLPHFSIALVLILLGSGEKFRLIK